MTNTEKFKSDDLVQRNGIYYKKFSNTPFSGIIMGNWGGFGFRIINGEFKDGMQHGIWELYDENGQLREYQEFKLGKLCGMQFHYFESGAISWKGNNVDGKMDGIWEWYGEDGVLRQATEYKDGVRDGSSISYYIDGTLWDKGIYKDGKKDGLWEHYDEKGKLSLKRKWKNGKILEVVDLKA